MVSLPPYMVVSSRLVFHQTTERGRCWQAAFHQLTQYPNYAMYLAAIMLGSHSWPCAHDNVNVRRFAPATVVVLSPPCHGLFSFHHSDDMMHASGASIMIALDFLLKLSNRNSTNPGRRVRNGDGIGQRDGEHGLLATFIGLRSRSHRGRLQRMS